MTAESRHYYVPNQAYANLSIVVLYFGMVAAEGMSLCTNSSFYLDSQHIFSQDCFLFEHWPSGTLEVPQELFS